MKEFQLTNPHSWLLVDVKDKDGKVDDVGLRGRGPEHAVARRHQAERLRPGTKLKITGNPMKDGTRAAIWVNAVRADGKTFNPRAGFAVR